MSITASIERIRRFRKYLGATPYQLARRAGLSHDALKRMDEPGWAPNSRTLLKLEAIIPEDFEA